MTDHDPRPAYEDVVSAGIQAREERDACSWSLGDLALYAVTTMGVTLTDYARAVNEDRSRMAGLKDNAHFYSPVERRKYPPHLAWWQYAKARRMSGWRPDQGEPTNDQRMYARELLFKWAETTVEPNGRHETPKNGALPVWIMGESPLPDGAAVVCLPGPAEDWRGLNVRIRVVR